MVTDFPASNIRTAVAFSTSVKGNAMIAITAVAKLLVFKGAALFTAPTLESNDFSSATEWSFESLIAHPAASLFNSLHALTFLIF